MKIKERKEERGITLIALVVTIVVLLILAGVTITTVLGEDGIIQKSKKAKLETEQSSILEQLRLAIYEKVLNVTNTNDYIEYLKKEGIIKQEIKDVAQTSKIASTKRVSASLGGEENIYYIIDVTKLISDPTTGLGEYETGDVYYILNGSLYYKDKSNAVKTMGQVFQTSEEIVADENFFNYIINENNEVEIVGIDFKKLNYEMVSDRGIYLSCVPYMRVDIGTLVIPDQIEGKNVTKISFDTNLNIPAFTPTSTTRTGMEGAIQGINKIVYPKYLKYIERSTIIFEDLTEIELPEGLEEIGSSSFQYCPIDNLIIPSTVKEIWWYAFYRCDALNNVTFLSRETSASWLGFYFYPSKENFEISYAD